METPVLCVKFVWKNKDTKRYQNDVCLVSLLLTLNRFRRFHNFEQISVFIIDFEQVNVSCLTLMFSSVLQLLQ